MKGRGPLKHPKAHQKPPPPLNHPNLTQTTLSHAKPSYTYQKHTRIQLSQKHIENHKEDIKIQLLKVIEKQLTGTGGIKRQIPLLKPKREINKYYK